MEIKKTKIPGCYEIIPKVLRDERGHFIKTFQKDIFQESGLQTDFVEEYYSVSRNCVLRGLHFQVPPMDHVKMVYCVAGQALDVVVDLRLGSPTYGQHEIFEMSSEKANMVYIPRGLAHGFYVLSDSVVMLYKVTSVYSSEHDAGILWSSAGIQWPDQAPIISKRDSCFPSLSNFISPFSYDLCSADVSYICPGLCQDLE